MTVLASMDILCCGGELRRTFVRLVKNTTLGERSKLKLNRFGKRVGQPAAPIFPSRRSRSTSAGSRCSGGP